MSLKSKDQHGSPPLCAWFGGTFDPIHLGHLNAVSELARQTGLKKVYLLPNHIPPHRSQPIATVQQRWDMLALAIQHQPLFSLDDRELRKNSPSYTLDTANQIRQAYGDSTPLAFIMGEDSFLSLPSWHDWESFFELFHILVCARACAGNITHFLQQKPRLKARQIQQNQVTKKLHQQPYGFFYLAQTPLWPISSSEIRRRCQSGESCQSLLPSSVWEYIQLKKLYVI